jgi:hypothetical protein
MVSRLLHTLRSTWIWNRSPTRQTECDVEARLEARFLVYQPMLWFLGEPSQSVTQADVFAYRDITDFRYHVSSYLPLPLHPFSAFWSAALIGRNQQKTPPTVSNASA